MLAAPKNLQLQLSEAVSLIADNDFPEKWPTLLPELIGKLSSSDWVVNKGVLATAHSIFGRWRSQFRSDKLYTEIKLVLTQFCVPYMELFRMTDQVISSGQAKDVHWETLNLLILVFYDLNCQDIPEFFEDNIKEFCGWFKKYLEMPAIDNEDDDEPDLVTEVKTNICEVIDLYAKRYEEEFGALLPDFVQTVWGLLTSVGQEPKFDLVRLITKD
jgi:exportin-2 (importin alpha re-exporter)